MLALELFTRDGGILLARYAHYLAGVTWIGLLWYFNFVQTPSFAVFDAPARTEAISKLVPRALWWFRWAAVFTVLSGFFVLGFQDQFDGDYFKSAPGISISTGALLGLIMLGNVWGVIWRNQKTVIKSAQGVMEGQAALPEAADAGRRAGLASRTNTVFSIPLLFFMAFTSHLAPKYSAAEGSDRAMYWLPVLVVIVLFELNGLGIIGGTGQTTIKKYLEKHTTAIATGFILAVAFYLWFEVAFSY
jgi:uncharacterized membrane protein